MSNTVTVYKSTDASAPVLTGQVSSLLTVLDACLVNGYGAKPAAGWTKPFVNSANIGCYKAATSVATGGTDAGAGLSVSINDAGVNATSVAREAQMRGFEALTSVSAGNGPFPTAAQIANSGLVLRKSFTADATAVPWTVIADDRTCYIIIDDPEFTGYGIYMFGEIFSLKSADSFRGLIIGRATQGPLIALDSDDTFQQLSGDAVAPGVLAGHYMPRNPKGDIQSAIQVGKHGDGVKGVNQLLVTTTRFGNGIVVWPNQTDGAAMLANIWVHDSIGGTINIRGRLRGVWQWLHPVGVLNDGDTFNGTGSLTGKTFVVVKPIARGDGLVLFENTSTWETN